MTAPDQPQRRPQADGGRPAHDRAWDGIELVLGDITHEQVDAVVNSASASLLGGAGVDGAVHAAAGPELLEACRELRATEWPDGLPVGRAVATPSGRLACRHVIHTLGPDRRIGQTDPDLLARSVRSSLDVAAELGCRTVALPAIGAGIFGWDLDDAARITVGAALDHPRPGIDVVRFVLFDQPALLAFERALAERMTA